MSGQNAMIVATDGRPISVCVSSPLQPSQRAVVVIQEWWGLVPHVESICDRLAQAGYTALAPDLYRGQTAAVPDAAKKLSRSV